MQAASVASSSYNSRAPSPPDWDPLLLACHAKKFRAAQTLINNGADIRTRTPTNESVLDIALKRLEKEDILLESMAGLLAAGCSPNAVSIMGESSLYWAVMRDNIAAIRLLLQGTVFISPLSRLPRKSRPLISFDVSFTQPVPQRSHSMERDQSVTLVP
jgi:ankyrin repeat protein